MPEPLKLYLDQMFRVDVAEALRREGYDVVRTSEVGQAPVKCALLSFGISRGRPGQMMRRYCRKRLLKIEFLLLLMNILVIG